MGLTRYKLGELIELQESRNEDLLLGVDDVRGISIQKVFINTKADMTGVSLRPYYLVAPDDFAYVTVTSRNGEKITLAHNSDSVTYLVSSSYVVFHVSETEILDSDYLFMYFNRPEFDRYARFNSWGSARETFTWDDICDIDIDLPPVEIQRKYVDIYQAMVANQKAYEQGLDDLRVLGEIEMDEIKKSAKRMQTGQILKAIDRRNSRSALSEVMGINITKQFMPSVAKVSEVAKAKYKVIESGEFGYSSMQTGRDKTIRIALNNSGEQVLVSPAYDVLQVSGEGVLAEYVMLWFSRAESDRLGWFASDASIRANLDLPRFFEIEIPIPNIEVQNSIVSIYKAYLERRAINDRLKAQIKDICPILIKGSLDEAREVRHG